MPLTGKLVVSRKLSSLSADGRVSVVLGCGVWGSAFGAAVARVGRVIFWDRRPELAERAAERCGGVSFSCREAAVAKAERVIVAVSSGGFADTLSWLAGRQEGKIVVWLTKGFDPTRGGPLCHTAASLLGAEGRYAAISGPSFAKEVAQGLPTALAVAANHRADAEALQVAFHSRWLRLYAEGDLVSLCVAGAVKNVIAIAAGISDAMALGENARAALITRGLAEMVTVCDALGGDSRHLLGLLGVGDLLLTATSDLSRNRRLGLAIGENPDRVFVSAEAGFLRQETCEGAVATSPILDSVAAQQVETPIISSVDRLLKGEETPRQALEALLARPPRR